MSNGTITKEFVFKGANSGISRKSGRPYATVELHDPSTLENTTFFLNEGQTVSTDGINFRDKVAASLEVTISNGRPAFILHGIKKIG